MARIGPRAVNQVVVASEREAALNNSARVRSRLWLWRAPLVSGNREGHWREPTDW